MAKLGLSIDLLIGIMEYKKYYNLSSLFCTIDILANEGLKSKNDIRFHSLKSIHYIEYPCINEELYMCVREYQYDNKIKSTSETIRILVKKALKDNIDILPTYNLLYKNLPLLIKINNIKWEIKSIEKIYKKSLIIIKENNI